MPIAAVEAHEDTEPVKMTPPRSRRSLSKGNDKARGEKKPVLEMSEKPELNEMDEKERLRQQRQDDIDRAMMIIRAKRDR